MPRVLVIDDDESFREVLLFHLREDGIEADGAAGGAQGLSRFDPAVHAVVLTDLKMPGMTGLEVMARVKERAPGCVVVVITAFGTVETAVEAMKAGAFDFLPKPCSRDHLRLVVRKALEHHGLRDRVRELERIVAAGEEELLVASEAMRRVVDLVDRAAATTATVLLAGESGTGKELLARRLHRRSPRSDGPFVAVNCAALPADLIESELFGHAKGAFTGAVRDRKGKFVLAAGGTLFLDEVAELPPSLQGKLLRALQERVIDVLGSETPVSVDARIVAATNRDLARAIQDGTFRADLFYRLAVVSVVVPPLRERREEILPLARRFLARHAPDPPLALSAAAEKKLLAHAWPGNVRELDNVCQRAALLADGDEVPAEGIDLADAAGGPGVPGAPGTIVLPEEGLSLTDLERDVIAQALARNGYNQAQTARYLRIPRHVLLYRIAKYGIKIPGRGDS